MAAPARRPEFILRSPCRRAPCSAPDQAGITATILSVLGSTMTISSLTMKYL